MTAIVSSIVPPAWQSSNACATSPSVRRDAPFRVALLSLAAFLAAVELGRAQDTAQQPATTSKQSVTSQIAPFLAGGAVALAAHESGHLLFDAIFDAHPGVKGVSFHGIPFFAITHDPTLTARREFVIDSAGFWVQEATNEILLTRRPNLRHEHAPFTKGVVAFNVIASAAYAGAAFARTGPVERDTRGMADSLRWKEPYVGLLILAPAILDAIRYYHPDAKWAAVASRGSKAFGVVLVFR